jgi:hypothetical protein
MVGIEDRPSSGPDTIRFRPAWERRILPRRVWHDACIKQNGAGRKAGPENPAGIRAIEGPAGRKENTMKTLKVALAVFILAVAAYPQTVDLGMGAFSNEKGPILMAVDASLVDQARNSPYVMFMLFMGAADKKSSYTVSAKDVVMVYKDQEYRMPSFTELREEYRGQVRDLDFYRRLGKEGIIASWVRFYEFPETATFFPPLTLNSTLAISQGYMVAFKGYMTPIYFKNPGFAKGDKLTIKVRDVKNPALTGECEVVLK